MKDLIPIVLFGSITAIVIFVTFVRYRERMEMIRKGPVNFLETPKKTGSLPLLFGLFSVALGLAFFTAALVQYFDRDVFTVGLFFIFGGGALIAYWKVTASDREQACDWYEQALSKKSDVPQNNNANA